MSILTEGQFERVGPFGATRLQVGARVGVHSGRGSTIDWRSATITAISVEPKKVGKRTLSRAVVTVEFDGPPFGRRKLTVRSVRAIVAMKEGQPKAEAKRQPKIGDRVILTRYKYSFSKIGCHGKITGLDGAPGVIQIWLDDPITNAQHEPKTNWNYCAMDWTYDDSPEPEPENNASAPAEAPEPDPSNGFTVGQRVVYTGNTDGILEAGDVGKVVHIGAVDICVEWDRESAQYHDGGGRGKNRHCWWVNMRYLAPDVPSSDYIVETEETIAELTEALWGMLATDGYKKHYEGDPHDRPGCSTCEQAAKAVDLLKKLGYPLPDKMPWDKDE